VDKLKYFIKMEIVIETHKNIYLQSQI